jgi:TPR repeat protein
MINSIAGKRLLESGICRTTTEVCLVGKTNRLCAPNWAETALVSDDGVEFCALDLPGICDAEDKSGSFGRVTLEWAAKCDVIAWVTDARTAFLTGSGGYEATELARLRDAVRAASDEDGSVRQFCIVLAKYEACASQERQRPPLVYREGEIRTETEETTIDGSFERAARVFGDTHIVRFSAYGRIARGPASDALKSIVARSTSAPAGSNETTFHLRWASDDLPEKRVAQLTRALRLSNEQRNKALRTMRLLEEPALKWYTMHETSADAQYEFGVLYLERSPIDAARWFRKSAEQGNADAQFWLGHMYQEGNGVALDATEAVKWYRKSAEQGDADAQFWLGYMYYKGNGVALNTTEAVKWFRKSASQGNADAQSTLGDMYYKGKGVALDLEEAARWYRESADQGNADAQFLLGYMYRNGSGVALDLTEAAKWYRKSAEQGNTDAQLWLGHMYYEGKGVALDLTEAAKWFRKSAAQGNAHAQFWLGHMYHEGKGVKLDPVEAAKWYERAKSAS